MSGSPIYINGKLVGAISYGSPFAKEPVGMVTPIADMLEAWDANLPKHASGYSSAQSLPEPSERSAASPSARSPSTRRAATRRTSRTARMYMQPLMTTMMVSGMSQRGIDGLPTS